MRHHGQRFLFVQDPDGNRVELATLGANPPADRMVDELGHPRTV